MLQSLLAYARGAGIDVALGVDRRNDEFFRLTKRIHNNLHGAAGDGGELGERERAVYEDALARTPSELAGPGQPGRRRLPPRPADRRADAPAASRACR